MTTLMLWIETFIPPGNHHPSISKSILLPISQPTATPTPISNILFCLTSKTLIQDISYILLLISYLLIKLVTKNIKMIKVCIPFIAPSYS